MDCDTTGIEPDFALVKFKKLAGGGYFKIINRLVPQALRTLGYGEGEIAAIERYALGRGTLKGAPGDQPREPGGEGLRRGRARRARSRARRGLRHQVRLQQMDARRGVLHRAARHRAGARSPIPASTCSAALGFYARRDRGRQHLVLRRDDAGGRAASEARAPRRVRLRQPVRAATARAASRSTATSG